MAGWLDLVKAGASKASPWVGAASTAYGIGKSLFGGHGGSGYGVDQNSINEALRLGHADPFSFQFDENDPELAYMRRQSLRRGQDTARHTMDEIGRAGLLGSGASFRLMDRDRLNLNRDLEDNEGSIYGARRSEAYDSYNRDLDWRRSIARTILGSRIDANNAYAHDAAAGQGAIGELGGRFLQDYWRKKYLSPGSEATYSPTVDYSLGPQPASSEDWAPSRGY